MTYDRLLKSENEPFVQTSKHLLNTNGKLIDVDQQQQQQQKLSRERSREAATPSTNTSAAAALLRVKSSRNGTGYNHKIHNENGKKLNSQRHKHHERYEKTPKAQIYFTYLCYYILELFGRIREFLRKIGLEKQKCYTDNNPKDFAPLLNSYESFHTRWVYVRNRDCFNRPVCSVPGAQIELLDRKSDDYNLTYYYTGQKRQVLNMGSYNYLGFAENNGPSSKEAIRSIEEHGVATSSSRVELGTLRPHQNLELLIARFLGVEDSIVCGMGFATNSMNIPALIGGKNSLILSDKLNHASIILGARLSGATIKPFKHNDVEDLEKQLRKAIIEGHPETRRPWRKILILVEGVYSMEGTITPLPEIIALKKKYKAYLYLDEAHSIGAVGKTGRGIVEHYGCDHRDVDILMGTFSKSFGAAGGYIAGTHKLINFLKQNSHANVYASSMSAPVCAQIIKTLEIIMGLDGTTEGQRRIAQLAENTKYFRDKLMKMGFIVYGHNASPVVPAMLYMPTKVALFNRMMLEKGIAVVTVGFPATDLPGGRVRFCLSAAHTREMLDQALDAIDYCGHWNGVKISKLNPAKSFKELKQLDAQQQQQQQRQK